MHLVKIQEDLLSLLNGHILHVVMDGHNLIIGKIRSEVHDLAAVTQTAPVFRNQGLVAEGGQTE